MKWIIAKGNPIDGFEFTGPFNDRDDAVEYGDSVASDWWVAEMDEPEMEKLDRAPRGERTIESEFPDYDNVHLNIPPFVCEPWCDDICPRYVWRGTTPDVKDCELTLWVNYYDPALREGNADYKMFCFTVGVVDDGRPIMDWAAESIEELREQLNDFYERHVGYRPDEDSNLGLGELLELVGTYVYLKAANVKDDIEAMGFDLIQTGGGCTAYILHRGLDYIVLTDDQGSTAENLTSWDNLLLGFYQQAQGEAVDEVEGPWPMIQHRAQEFKDGKWTPPAQEIDPHTY